MDSNNNRYYYHNSNKISIRIWSVEIPMMNPVHWVLLKLNRCPFCRTKLTEKEYGGTTEIMTLIWYVYECPKCKRKKR